MSTLLTHYPSPNDPRHFYFPPPLLTRPPRSTTSSTFPSIRHGDRNRDRERLPSLTSLAPPPPPSVYRTPSASFAAPKSAPLHLPSISTLSCPPLGRPPILTPRGHVYAAPENRVSSMRSMPENSVGGSRASSMSSDGRGAGTAGAHGLRDAQAEKDEFMAHQTRSTRRRKGKTIEEDDAEGDTSTRSDKRRRVTRASNAGAGTDESYRESASPEEEAPAGRGARRTKGAPPAIKTMGFAASREARRESNNSNPEGVSTVPRPIDFDHPIPSPVVMGFDFKAIDNEQLRTVRDTISIKEQQQALIAARRRDVIASTPTTPKELSFKTWQPKDPEKQTGVGRRRDKVRDKVEKMTIDTGAGDKDTQPGSKSAPLGAGFSSQQHGGREYPASGSQTAIPPHTLPPIGYPPNGMDLRTAPIGHGRSGREDQELARRGLVAGPYPGHPQFRRYDPSQSSRAGEAYMRGHAVPIASGGGGPPTHGHGHNGYAPPGANSDSVSPPHQAHTRRESGSHRSHHGSLGGNESIMPGPPPPGPGPMIPHGAPPSGYPYNALMDNLQQAEALKFTLQDLLHRYESAYATGASRLADFKAHNNSASNLLATLQQSADSLREMVRYEVHKLSSGERKELEELRERMKVLEAKLGVIPPRQAEAPATSAGTGENSGSAKGAEGNGKPKRTPRGGKKREKAKDAMEVDGDAEADADAEEDELDEDQ